MLARHLAVCGLEADQIVARLGMDHAELRATVRDYFRAQLEVGKQRINADGPLSASQRQSFEKSLSLLEAGNGEFWHVVGSDHARQELDDFFSATGQPREKYREHIPQVLDELRKARIGLYKALQEHAAGLETYYFTETPSAPPVGSDAPPRAMHGPGIQETAEAFLQEQKTTAGVTASTIKKRRAILETAIEWFGADTPIAGIDKRAAGEFKRAILALPSNRFKSPKLEGLSLRDAITVPDVPKISNGTVNAYISALKVFWAWAEAHGYTENALFSGMTVAKRGHESRDTRPFTQDALGKVFAAVTDDRGKFRDKVSHRWATLIAMFSGARQNEVCQLETTDLREVEGVWVFDFTDEGSDEKRLKSSAARRMVPIHSRLIELGLLQFRAEMQAKGHNRLFPDYTYSEKHGHGDKLSKWFNRTLVKHLGIKSEAHTFHGLRHTFATRLGQADVPTERIQFIVGHEREGVTHQVYMKEGYTLEQTRQAVERYQV